jgi:hypothetical protein
MREIRTLRATWRGLETWNGQIATAAGAPVLDPTCERPEVKSLRPTHHEAFNVLKTKGYNLEHNFGHGKRNLSTVLAILNLLAFACHTVCELAAGPWRAARRELVTRQGFFQALRIITSYLVFDSWDDLLRTLAFARPPPLGP